MYMLQWSEMRVLANEKDQNIHSSTTNMGFCK